MNKYDEFMNRIEITPDMRSRLLSGITAAVNENTDDAAGTGAVNEEKAAETKRTDDGSYRLRRIIRIAVPLVAAAAVLVLAFVFGSRLFARKGASGAAPAAYDQAVSGGGSADMGNRSDSADGVMEAAAEEAAVAEMEEALMEMDTEEKAETAAAAATAPETAAVTASDALEAVPYNVFYTNHHIPLTGAEYPSVTLVTSRTQLEDTFMTDSYEDPLASQEFLSEMECSEFTDTFFETKDVLIILLEEDSGSVSHTLTSIERADTGSPWTVHIRRRVPEMQTEDMAYWYIVAEIDKNLLENSSVEIEID